MEFCFVLCFHFLGYLHSAYTFGMEAHLADTTINGSLVPPSALVTLVQKGLLFTEAEISVSETGQERTVDPLSLIDAIMPEIVARKAAEIAANASQNAADGQILGAGSSKNAADQLNQNSNLKHPNNVHKNALKNHVISNGDDGNLANNNNHVTMEIDGDLNNSTAPAAVPINNGPVAGSGSASGLGIRNKFSSLAQNHSVANNSNLATSAGNQASNQAGNQAVPSTSKLEIPSNKVKVLTGHESEVFICAWNPKMDILASG